jgi:sterol-4alpha-carboxylate 3-dehydrogenase (decarboxylating)
MTDGNASLTVVVTGGSGCLGLAIIQCLQERLPRVLIHVLDISIPVTNNKSISGIEFHQVDICSANRVSELITKIQPRVVLHTAALIPSAAKRLGVGNDGIKRVNVQGTQNVLDAAKKAGSVDAFVYTSSCDVVKGDSWGNLINANERMASVHKFDETYPETKVPIQPYRSRLQANFYQAIAEHIVLSSASSSFKAAAIRTHGIIGANDNNIVPLLATAPRGISLGPGTNLYDFSSASNVALAHVLAVENLLSPKTEATKSANGKAFFVTDQRPLPMKRIMEMIWECLDTDRIENEKGKDQKLKIFIPVRLAYAIIWVLSLLAQVLGKKPWISTNELGDSLSVRYFDNSRAREVLGYVPESKLEEAIRDACRTYKAREGKGIVKS